MLLAFIYYYYQVVCVFKSLWSFTLILIRSSKIIYFNIFRLCIYSLVKNFKLTNNIEDFILVITFTHFKFLPLNLLLGLNAIFLIKNHAAGTSVETEVHGKRQLKLLNHGETYEMNSPKLLIKFLPIPWVDWVGEHRIRCHETGLEAELYYGSSSFFGLRGNPRTVKGKIFDSMSFELLYEIDGQWDR